MYDLKTLFDAINERAEYHSKTLNDSTDEKLLTESKTELLVIHDACLEIIDKVSPHLDVPGVGSIIFNVYINRTIS
jgi:hypothetical protein